MLSAREGRGGGGSLRIWNIRKATPWQGEFFEAGSSEGTKSRGGWWCCRRLDADVCCLKIHTAFRSSNTAPSAWVARLLLDSDLDLSDLGNVKRRHDASDVRWIKKKSKKEKKKKKKGERTWCEAALAQARQRKTGISCVLRSEYKCPLHKTSTGALWPKKHSSHSELYLS